MSNNNYSKYYYKIVYYGGLLYILSLILEGPIRYILYLGGGQYILYSRDLFIALCIICYLLHAAREFVIDRLLLVIIIIFIFHSIISLYYVGNISMILFAWKVYFPLFFGILFGQLFFINLRLTVKYFTILCIVAIVGVFVNYYKTFPWEGLEYTLFGFDIEAVRFWTAWEFKRVSGFARTSFDSAIQILLLAIFLICYLKNKSLKLLLWLLAGSAILLTTTKGVILAYLVTSLLIIIIRYIPNYFNIYQKVLFVLIGIVIILPLFSVQSLGVGNIPLLFKSLYERMIISWPDVFKLVQENGNILLGRGLGGMGTSQLYFEIQKYNPGDNIFLFFYANFGILGAGYLLYLSIIGQSIDLNTELYYYLFIISFFIYGITTTCTENAMFNFFLGNYIAYVGNLKMRHVHDATFILKEAPEGQSNT